MTNEKARWTEGKGKCPVCLRLDYYLGRHMAEYHPKARK